MRFVAACAAAGHYPLAAITRDDSRAEGDPGSSGLLGR
jgi:hypothetical protein